MTHIAELARDFLAQDRIAVRELGPYVSRLFLKPADGILQDHTGRAPS